MLKNTIIPALVLSITIFSAQSPAQSSVNPEVFQNNITKMNFNLVSLDTSPALEKTTTHSPGANSVKVAWSIKSAYKKSKRAVKKAGRNTGRAIRELNKVIVPSEIRNGSSYLYRKDRAAFRFIGRTGRNIGKALVSYKRCLTRGCGRIGDLPNPHDHRR